MSVDIRRSSARFVERAPGRASRHAFSFGPHYDPDLLGFGPMVCHDEHLLGSGQGFDTHRHSGLTIVTWVGAGALAHSGPDGERVVPAGSLAVFTTGDGAEHAEHAAPDVGPTRFVQVWMRDDEPPASSSYVVHEAAGSLDAGLDVGAGRHLDVVRLDAGATYRLPEADLVHLYVDSGALLRSSLAEPLAAGDAFLVTRDEHTPLYEVTTGVPTVLLVWSFATTP